MRCRVEYKTMSKLLLHGLTWAAAAVVIYSEPLGEWLDEHYPIGGKH
jgi:hypothetical protein